MSETKNATAPQVLYARLKPYDPDKGHVLKRFTLLTKSGPVRFLEARGWLKVTPKLGARLEKVRQHRRKLDSALAFDVCTLEEAKKIQARERNRRGGRRTVEDAETEDDSTLTTENVPDQEGRRSKRRKSGGGFLSNEEDFTPAKERRAKARQEEEEDEEEVEEAPELDETDDEEELDDVQDKAPLEDPEEQAGDGEAKRPKLAADPDPDGNDLKETDEDEGRVEDLGKLDEPGGEKTQPQRRRGPKAKTAKT